MAWGFIRACPVIDQLLSPLITRLSNKNGTGLPSQSSSAQNTEFVLEKTRTFCTFYVCEYFAVQVYQWLRLENLVRKVEAAGLLVSTYIPHRDLRSMQLTAGGYRILTVPNAGGNSIVSEVLSFELLSRCFSAKLKKTEMEVTYFPHGGSITDYVCEIFQTTVGVSVTRAMKFQGDYTTEDAYHLLNKKLKGVIQSSKNSMLKWKKQILHVWAGSEQVANILGQVYTKIDPDIRTNTVVIVTVAAGTDFIFRNA